MLTGVSANVPARSFVAHGRTTIVMVAVSHPGVGDALSQTWYSKVSIPAKSRSDT